MHFFLHYATPDNKYDVFYFNVVRNFFFLSLVLRTKRRDRFFLNDNYDCDCKRIFGGYDKGKQELFYFLQPKNDKNMCASLELLT